MEIFSGLWLTTEERCVILVSVTETKTQPQTEADMEKVISLVQASVIETAKIKGINIQDEFGTVDKFKNYILSFTIKTLVDFGIEVKVAFDMVLGEGKHRELADRIWESAKA